MTAHRRRSERTPERMSATSFITRARTGILFPETSAGWVPYIVQLPCRRRECEVIVRLQANQSSASTFFVGSKHVRNLRRCSMVGKRLLFAFAALAVASVSPRLAAQPVDFRMGPLETYRNERFGFILRYPAAVFEPAEQQSSEDGRLFVTRDGEARLIASAGINSAAETL